MWTINLTTQKSERSSGFHGEKNVLRFQYAELVYIMLLSL